MGTITDNINKLNTKIALYVRYLTLLLTFVVVYSVIARYFFRTPDVRTFFLGNWLYGITFLLGGAYTLYIGGHVSVDVLYTRMPLSIRRVLKVLDLFVVLLFCLIMLPTAISLAWHSTLINELDSSMVTFAPPIWWYKWFMVLSLVLLALQSISLISESLKGERGDDQ